MNAKVTASVWRSAGRSKGAWFVSASEMLGAGSTPIAPKRHLAPGQHAADEAIGMIQNTPWPKPHVRPVHRKEDDVDRKAEE